MGNRILDHEQIKCMIGLSNLLDGRPQSCVIMDQTPHMAFVCVRGWVMPADMWLILGMWHILGAQVYSNRVGRDVWNLVLKELNPDKNSRKLPIDTCWNEIQTWIHSDGVKPEDLIQWYKELIPDCVAPIPHS